MVQWYNGTISILRIFEMVQWYNGTISILRICSLEVTIWLKDYENLGD